MPKVLISDKLSESAVDIFKKNKIETIYNPVLSHEDLLKEINKYDGLAIRSATKVTEEVFENAKNLKIVGRAGIGTDNIDKLSATKNGVIVMNTPFGNAVTTAEHAIALMMSLVRMIPQADRSTKLGKWEKSKFNGTEINGKYLGLIGCGNIGSIVASRALGLKMKVLAYDPFLIQEKASELGIEKVDLEYLLKNSDIISLHTPLTEDTKNIISSEAISIMKKGSRIINCARGGLVDEVACRAALETGHLAGAAFDVFIEEPAKENILFDAPNFVATPHLGAATIEAQENVAIQIAQQMSDYLNTGAVVNALNYPSVSAEEAPILKPYVRLAYLMGSFLGQVTQEGILSVKLELEGKASNLLDVPLMSSLLVGILEPSSAAVNDISSTSIASSRGINLSTIKHERRCDYETLLKITIKHDNGERTITGTLIAGNKPRIINIQGISIESEFPKNALYLRNYDKPGFIGDLGNKLGNNNINIASFHLGRRNVGGEAIALVEIDGKIDEKIISEIRNLPQVARVNSINFEGK